MTGSPDLTLGVEEELFVVDCDAYDLVADPEPALLEAWSEVDGPCRVVPELLRSQLETNSKVCTSVRDMREVLCASRRAILELADRYGVDLIASSTHPFASWQTQVVTPRDRYREFATKYQSVIRQLLASGMHVHAGFGTRDERIQVMTAMRQYLPLFLTFSGSSPFHSGQITGFKSWRLNLLAALPRSGMPPALHAWQDFEGIIETYRSMQFIADGSEIWWDIRPSIKYPTLELRISDICPRVDDAMCAIALYACLVRHLLNRARAGTLPEDPPAEIIAQNRWLAQRYGVVAFFADHAAGSRIDLVDYVEAVQEMLAPDAAALDCEHELAHMRTIVLEGSSADRQLDHYRLCLLDGADEKEALRSVTQLVARETREGVMDGAGGTAHPTG